MSNNFFSVDDSFPVIPGSDLLFSPLAAQLPPTPLDNTHGTTPSNKRQREPEKPKDFTSTDLSKLLSSENPNDIVSALNYLLEKSADHDLNFALGREGHKVIDALVSLFDETIGWKHGNKNWIIREDEDGIIPTENSWKCTAKPCTSADGAIDNLEWTSFCLTRFAPSSLNTGMNASHIPSYNMVNVDNDREGMRILEIILMIVRNLSYVQGNVRYIMHSFGMMRVLTGSLYFRNFYTGKEFRGTRSGKEETDLIAGNSSNNLCLHAINVFHNIAPMLDPSGKKIFYELYLLDEEIDVDKSTVKAARYAESIDIKSYVNSEIYGKIQGMGWTGMRLASKFNVKDDILPDMPEDLFLPAVKNYIRTSMAVFPALFGLLRVRSSRAVVVQCLEMIMILVDNPDIRDVFLHTPDAFLGQLVYLLWIPRLGVDSLEYMDPIINSVSRVSAMKLLAGYDMSVDYEIRDRSIEILQKITSLSDDLKRRAACKIIITQSEDFTVDEAKTTNQPNTKLYDAIFPMLTTRAGREHTPLFAAKLLAQLATVEENKRGIQYCERKVVNALASANKDVVQILVNDVLSKLDQ